MAAPPPAPSAASATEPPQPPLTKLEVRGLSFNTVDTGGKGPALILLHGFPCSWKLWKLQIPALQEAGYRVVAPDLRGSGDTEPKPQEPETYAMASLVQDVVGILDALSIQQAGVISHDWGAALGWAVAASHPDRVSSLCVMTVGHPNGFFNEPHGFKQRQLSWYMLLFQYRPQAEDALLSGVSIFPPPSKPLQCMPYFMEMLADVQKPGTITGGLNWYRANVGPESFINGYFVKDFPEAKIKVPVLGIMPTEDEALCPEQMQASEKFIESPGTWQYELVECATHFITWEAADKVNKLLLAFLGKHSSSEL